MHLCSYGKHADAVPDKDFQFWSHLTRTPCSSHNVNDVWQTPSAFFCVLWSEKAFFWQPFKWGCGYGGGVWWCFLKSGDSKTPQDSFTVILFFRCFCWFCCFSHHSPQYPGSSTHEVFNSSISFELLYNYSDSAQWYIQFANFIVAIYEGLQRSASFELPIILFSSWCWMILHVCCLIFIPYWNRKLGNHSIQFRNTYSALKKYSYPLNVFTFFHLTTTNCFFIEILCDRPTQSST